MASQMPSAAYRRKFSFPVSMQSSSLLAEPSAGISARRRLSNVSDVMSRKFSTTIGLGWNRPPPIPTQEIVSQGKCLCGQYIRTRLKRAGMFTRKLGLQRLRSVIGTPSGHVVRDVFPDLAEMGLQLEQMHPKVYTGVARQSSRTPGGELPTAESAPALLVAISRELFKTSISWGKVVSLFAVCGGLAVDCVRQGHPDYLCHLLDGVEEVIEDELAPWIASNGGWVGLSLHCNPPTVDLSTPDCCCVVLLGLTVVVIIYVLGKTVGNVAVPLILEMF